MNSLKSNVNGPWPINDDAEGEAYSINAQESMLFNFHLIPSADSPLCPHLSSACSVCHRHACISFFFKEKGKERERRIY